MGIEMAPVVRRRAGRLGIARIGLLTVTEAEFEIVRPVFGLAENCLDSPYYVRDKRKWDHHVVLRRSPGQTNVVSALAVSGMIEDFRPEFVFLIGTAGGYSGRDKLLLGDVVVAEYVTNSGYWKYKDGQVLLRKLAHDHPSFFLLDRFVEALRTDPDAWRQRMSRRHAENPEPKILRGEVVSGDRIYGDPDNAEQRQILQVFDKALAFEMEAFGLARTIYEARMYVNYNPQFLVIRGISDLVNSDAASNQATRDFWTPYAVSAAAAVTHVLVERLLGHLSAVETRSGRNWFRRWRNHRGA